MQAGVVIVGAGLVGAAAALSLAKTCQNMQVILVDVAEPCEYLSKENQWHSRVSAISLASQCLLESLGVWNAACQQRAAAYRQLLLWEHDGASQLQFSADDSGLECLGSILENDLLLNALHAELERQSNVECCWRTQVSSFSVNATQVEMQLTDLSGTETVRAQLLIGADGPGSRIRQLGCFNVTQKAYHHHALVAHLQSSQAHLGRASQVFTSTGPVAFLPLTPPSEPVQKVAQHWVSLVWSGPSPQMQLLLSADEDDFLAEINGLVPGYLGQILECTKRSAYPLQRLHVSPSVLDRVALIGDAAHVVHPLAGLGVNLGLADVAELTARIATRFQRRLDLGDLNSLQIYQRARAPHVQSVLHLTDGLKHLYAQPMPPSLKLLSGYGLNLLDAMGLAKQGLVQCATLSAQNWPKPMLSLV